MYAKILGLTLAVAAPLLYAYPCQALEEEGEAAASVAIVADVVARVDSEGDLAEPAVGVVCLKAEGDPASNVFIANADPHAPHYCLVKGGPVSVDVNVDTAADPNRGWLGIQLAQVSPDLAAHFPAAEDGVMIHNVVKDSPAQDAGLERFDVIVSINDETVSGGVAGMAKAVGAFEPGSEVTFGVLRDGREITVDATLSSRPATQEIDWIHELFPEKVYRQFRNTRGKILSKDEDGNWQLEDLGDLSELEDLPDTIRKLLPGREEMTVKVIVDEDQESINTVVIRDGTTIAIEQEDGGDIVVTQTDPDGNETEDIYADAEALKAADKEIYEIYESAVGGKCSIHLGPGGPQGLRWHTMPGTGRALTEAREEWKEQMESAMHEARDALAEARRSMDEARKMRLQLRLPQHPFFWGEEEGEPGAFGSAMLFSVAKRSFRVNPDGEIEVVIRQDDTEVTKVFEDEADLEERDPELYEEYAKVTFGE